MDYSVVYDVAQETPDIGFPAFGLIFVALGALLWRYRDQMPASGYGPFRSRKAFVSVFLGFGILWTSIASLGVLGSYFGARRSLSDGTARVVEGVVQDFHAMPYSGHDTERFTVGGVRFAYSDYSVGAGFNNTSSHGGPIREGLLVRIHYTGSQGRTTILQLEIKK